MVRDLQPFVAARSRVEEDCLWVLGNERPVQEVAGPVRHYYHSSITYGRFYGV